MPPSVPPLGHALIDRQHRGIRARCAVFLKAALRGAGRRELTALMAATRRHFASEDRLMDASRYPERVGHRALHEGVWNDMARMRAQLAEGRPLHLRQAGMVLEWLAHHTDEADRNLVAHLAARRSASAGARKRRS